MRYAWLTSCLKSDWFVLFTCWYPAECAEVGVGVGCKPTDFMSGRFVAYNSHEDDMNEVACFGQYIIHSMERRNSSCGMDSVGHVMLSFYKCRSSETIGHRKCWISSGFCSFGPGRMLVHMRFDIWYLENQLWGTQKYLIRCTNTPVVGYRSRKTLDMRNVQYVRKPAAKFDESGSRRVIHVSVNPQIHSDAKLPTRPIPLIGLIWK